MSEHYFGLMIEDLGIQAEPRTIHELFSVYDKDLDGKIDVDNFCDSFNLERQSVKKPDIFFQDVVLTDVPKDGKPFQRRPAAAKQSYAELEKMFLPKRAAKSELGKLVPARSRSVAGVSPARKRLGDISHEHHDLPVGSMLPPRPMTAMSASGGFDMHAPRLQQRAVTPLQQLQVSVCCGHFGHCICGNRKDAFMRMTKRHVVRFRSVCISRRCRRHRQRFEISLQTCRRGKQALRLCRRHVIVSTIMVRQR